MPSYLHNPSPGSGPQVSAVVPVLAEEESLRCVVEGLREGLGQALAEVIIVVSPLSPIGTLKVCRDLDRAGHALVCEQQRGPGVGFAYREGMAAARSEFILCIDSDGEMDPATAAQLLQAQRDTGADLVVASRWAKGGGLEGYGPAKYWLNWAFQRLFRVVFRTRLTDLTHGYKLLRSNLARRLPLCSSGQEIGCETTLLPLRLNAAVAEVPTVWRSRQAGRSTGQPLGGLRYVAAAWRILRWRGVLPPDPGPRPALPIDWAAALSSLRPDRSE